ncbi:hypothetical protein [Bacillus toyonensis]|nr:hypothetical protein [Bacillus toyonensis]
MDTKLRKMIQFMNRKAYDLQFKMAAVQLVLGKYVYKRGCQRIVDLF